jgi:AraC-like DNA-binding protein
LRAPHLYPTTSLLAARLGEVSVTEVAYHLGFSNLGRLAGDYRRTFGERPSDTLARPFRDEAPPIWWEAAETSRLSERLARPPRD